MLFEILASIQLLSIKFVISNYSKGYMEVRHFFTSCSYFIDFYLSYYYTIYSLTKLKVVFEILGSKPESSIGSLWKVQNKNAQNRLFI